MSGLQTINNRWNWSNIGIIREKNELFIYKVSICNCWSILTKIGSIWIESCKPSFSLVSKFLIERKLNSLFIVLARKFKINFMPLKIWEVFFGFIIIWCSKTFVILNCISFCIVMLSLPFNKLRESVKWFFFSLFICSNIFVFQFLEYFNNWCYKFTKKSRAFNQIRPHWMNKVNNKTFNMWTILILICHDHNWTISKLI